MVTFHFHYFKRTPQTPNRSSKMASPTTVWDGNAMSQEDMMMKDTVLVLDDDDNVIGSASKRKSHEFTMEQPRAILHRAFSVFIFDESTGELLLQQRASSKITFPNVRISQQNERAGINQSSGLMTGFELESDSTGYHDSTNHCAPIYSHIFALLPSILLFYVFKGLDQHLLLASSSRNGTSRSRQTGRRRQWNRLGGQECCHSKARSRTRYSCLGS